MDVLLTHIPDPDNAGVGTFFGVTACIVPFGDFFVALFAGVRKFEHKVKICMKNKMTIRLVESAVMLAFAVVLSLVKVIDMPYGGSVTLCSMLPIVLISYRYGVKWGLLVGFAGALIQMLVGMEDLAYATSPMAAAAIILLDYIVAFTVLGLGGMFRGCIKNQATSVAAGALVCCVLRYICHVISGCTVWVGVSIPTADGVIYSIIYNAAYMVPETIVTIAGALAICGMLDFREESLKRLSKRKGSLSSSISAAVAIIAVAVDAVLLFAAIQGEKGFDITLIAGANWLLIGIVGAVAVLATALALVFLQSSKSKRSNAANEKEQKNSN